MEVGLIDKGGLLNATAYGNREHLGYKQVQNQVRHFYLEETTFPGAYRNKKAKFHSDHPIRVEPLHQCHKFKQNPATTLKKPPEAPENVHQSIHSHCPQPLHPLTNPLQHPLHSLFPKTPLPCQNTHLHLPRSRPPNTQFPPHKPDSSSYTYGTASPRLSLPRARNRGMLLRTRFACSRARACCAGG